MICSKCVHNSERDDRIDYEALCHTCIKNNYCYYENITKDQDFQRFYKPTNLAQVFDEKLTGNLIIGLETITELKLLGGKKNPMKGRVTKRTVYSAMVYSNKNSNGYENAVRRNLANEGIDPMSFSVGARTWGERVVGYPIIKHKDQYYLECILLNNNPESEYLLDGKPIAKEDIEGLKPKREDSNNVPIRAFKLSSILRLTTCKKDYHNLTFDPEYK